jgi:hypothetical protein
MMTALVVLDEAAVSRLKKAVDTNLDLIVWVGDWLSHLNLFSDAQVYDILRFAKVEIERFAEVAEAGLESQRIATLVVCDSRWVSFSGVAMFLDTETTDLVPDLGEFAVTHIMCDIAALRARMQYRQGRFNAKSKPDGDSNPAALHEAE